MKKIYEDKSIESIKRKSERLLTNSEREFLLECYKNQKHYKLLILVILEQSTIISKPSTA